MSDLNDEARLQPLHSFGGSSFFQRKFTSAFRTKIIALSFVCLKMVRFRYASLFIVVALLQAWRMLPEYYMRCLFSNSERWYDS
mmetsp:Transcript_15751/g.24525  ORF Transcript_15751/g.24525 Transcript_15751/m.24525 type:complete len:84 (-) Transcript_15751:1398-1649(-)